jgi:hypothetical protein
MCPSRSGGTSDEPGACGERPGPRGSEVAPGRAAGARARAPVAPTRNARRYLAGSAAYSPVLTAFDPRPHTGG